MKSQYNEIQVTKLVYILQENIEINVLTGKTRQNAENKQSFGLTGKIENILFQAFLSTFNVFIILSIALSCFSFCAFKVTLSSFNFRFCSFKTPFSSLTA